MLYYLKTLHGTCYNVTGITFPDIQPIDWDSFPLERWEHLFGWSNQAPVAVLNIRDKDEYEDIDSRLPYGLILTEHWEAHLDDETPAANPHRILCELDQSRKVATEMESNNVL